jgi:hypothetical protein
MASGNKAEPKIRQQITKPQGTFRVLDRMMGRALQRVILLIENDAMIGRQPSSPAECGKCWQADPRGDSA